MAGDSADKTKDPTSEFRRSVGRIAQFRPFGEGKLEVDFARREFILAAAVENGGGFSSLADCQQVCDGLWGIALDLDEVRDEVKKLVKDGKLDRGSKESYRLSTDAAAELGDRVRESEAAEAQAIAEWETSVRAMDPDLTDEELGELREDLTTWVQQIIVRHGMEAALVLYPEQAQSRADDFLKQVEEAGYEHLPQRADHVQSVREKALYIFLRNPTAVQRRYLANLMSTAYLAAVFTIDPDAHALVKEITRGQRIYLDTNLVYDLLGLRGPRNHMTIRQVLAHTRELGYDICVTPWTVSEMKYSVRKAREELHKTSLPPQALADLAAEACGDQGYLTAYWRKYKETGVRPDDFFDLHEQIEGLLEKAQVRIETEGVTRTDQNEDGLAEQVGLLATIPGGASKPRPVLEHDAKHRMLVERLRTGHRQFSNAGYWFLTRDSVLIPYATERRASSTALPFAVSLTAWTHIVRSLSPRTADYDQTLVDLLDTPSVRPKGMVNFDTVAEVLGRVELLVEDSTEAIASRMLLDQAVMEGVEKRSGESRERFVDDAIQEKKAELERQLAQTEEAAARERVERERAEKRAVEHERRLKAERERRNRAETESRELERKRNEERLVEEERQRQLEVERQAAQEGKDAATDEVAKLKSQLADKDRDATRQARNVRFAWAGLVAILGLAVGILPPATGWVTDGLPLVGLIVAGILLLIAAIAIAFGRKQAAYVLSAVGIVIGIAVGIQQLVSSDDPSEAGAGQNQADK